MKKTDPKKSEGARMERAAFRAYIRRQLKIYPGAVLRGVLAWVLGRQSRYDKKKGGLGRQ